MGGWPRTANSKLVDIPGGPIVKLGLAFLPLAALTIIFIAGIEASSYSSPSVVSQYKTPFAFLDQFYPPAVAENAKIKVQTEENAKMEAKAKAAAKAKAEAKAKAKAEEEAAATWRSSWSTAPRVPKTRRSPQSYRHRARYTCVKLWVSLFQQKSAL